MERHMHFPVRTVVSGATGLGLVASVLTAVVALTGAAPASAATCTPPSQETRYRAVDNANNVDVADGVRGILRTPRSGEITGIGTSSSPLASVADVSLDFGSGEPSNENFVQ